MYAPFYCVDAAFGFRNHAAANDAALYERGNFVRLYDRDERVRVVLVLKNAADICHGYKALRVERAGDLRRGGVRVYVIDIALAVAADGRNDRDISLVDNVEYRLNIYICYLADEAELLVFYLRFNHVAVYSGESHRLAALVFNEVDEAFVDLSGEHHLHYIGGLLVRDAQTVDEFTLFAGLLEHIRYLRAAAVNQNDFYANEPEQHDVAHDGIF